MTKTEYIQERLKDPDLTPGYRKILKEILAQQISYHGFHVGEQIAVGENGDPAIVITPDELCRIEPVWSNYRDTLKERVPFRYTEGGLTGMGRKAGGSTPNGVRRVK